MLLEKGVAVNERLVMYEKSALSHTVDHGRLAMARLLLENGAGVSIRRDNRCARGQGVAGFGQVATGRAGHLRRDSNERKGNYIGRNYWNLYLVQLW